MTAPPTLLLIPTLFERERLDALGALPGELTTAVCGLGPVAAAACTARLLAEHRPSEVILGGLAGSYELERLRVGELVEFTEVAIDGIGVGEGESARGLEALGFAQWEDERERILDRITLRSDEPTRLLLTVCATSADREHAALRRKRFPAALAEDMEGFGVALACRLAGVRLRIVRGICNAVGDRDIEQWAVEPALAAVHEWLRGSREYRATGSV